MKKTLARLIALADSLDSKGLNNEADLLDEMMKEFTERTEVIDKRIDELLESEFSEGNNLKEFFASFVKLRECSKDKAKITALAIKAQVSEQYMKTQINNLLDIRDDLIYQNTEELIKENLDNFAALKDVIKLLVDTKIERRFISDADKERL